MKVKILLCLCAAWFAMFGAASAGSQTVITEIPPEGLAITESGTYSFANDIAWAGQESALAGITIIDAANVVLDLGGHCLSAPRDVRLSGTFGIAALAVQNLSIKNGTIKGFQLAGVALGLSAGVTLSNIVISDIGNGVPGYAPTGLSATMCQDLTFNQVSVLNVNGSSEPGGSGIGIVAGVSLTECKNVYFDGRVSGINGYSSLVSGVFGLLCDGISLQEAVIESVNGSAGAVSGASFLLSRNISVDKSLVSNLHNDAGVCSGIAGVDSRQINVLDTTVSRLSTGLMPNENAPGHTCIGMVFAPFTVVVGGVRKINVVDRGAHYSQLLLPTVKIAPPLAGGETAHGFPLIDSEGDLDGVLILSPGSGYDQAPKVEIVPNPLWTAGTGATATAEVGHFVEVGSAGDILVEKCTISDITGSCDDAHGISLFVVSKSTVREVTVENVTDGRGGRGAKATGIEVYGLINNLPSDILVENCRVRNISAISPGDLQAAGYSVAGKGVTFSNCEADNITVSGVNPVHPESPGYGIGFAWAPDIREQYQYPALDTRIENCTASNCRLGFDTFYFQNSTWSRFKSINNGRPYRDEPTGALRVLYCDGCSECPDAPQKSPEDWFKEVPLQNTASGNIIEMEKPRIR